MGQSAAVNAGAGWVAGVSGMLLHRGRRVPGARGQDPIGNSIRATRGDGDPVRLLAEVGLDDCLWRRVHGGWTGSLVSSSTRERSTITRPSTTPSTPSSRRLRRAGTLAAAATIALSATFGLGIAPASAAPASASTSTDASQITVPGAKPGPAPKWPGPLFRFVFQTHWIPVAHGGQNIRSFRVQGHSVRPGGTLAYNDVNECVSYTGYSDKIDDVRYAGVVLPQIYDTTVTSFSGPHCTGYDYDYGRVGGRGPIDRQYLDWTIFTHHAPAPR